MPNSQRQNRRHGLAVSFRFRAQPENTRALQDAPSSATGKSILPITPVQNQAGKFCGRRGKHPPSIATFLGKRSWCCACSSRTSSSAPRRSAPRPSRGRKYSYAQCFFSAFVAKQKSIEHPPVRLADAALAHRLKDVAETKCGIMGCPFLPSVATVAFALGGSTQAHPPGLSLLPLPSSPHGHQ